MKSVTTALKEVFKEFGVHIGDGTLYSDPRKPANLTPGYKAVGVKVCFTKFTEQTINRVVRTMQDRGYHFHYAHFNQAKGTWPGIPGTRFCFSMPEKNAAVCAVD